VTTSEGGYWQTKGSCEVQAWSAQCAPAANGVPSFTKNMQSSPVPLLFGCPPMIWLHFSYDCSGFGAGGKVVPSSVHRQVPSTS